MLIVNEKVDSIITRFTRKVLSTPVILTLLAMSLIIVISFFNLTDYPDMNVGVLTLLQDLEGKDVTYKEPNNSGIALLVYALHKVLPVDYLWLLIFWQLVGLAGYLIVFYKLTNSLKLTALTLVYPLVLINTYLADTSVAMFLYMLTIYLYIHKHKIAAYSLALFLPMFRHEGIAVFGALLLYEFFAVKAYKNGTSFLKYLKTNTIPIILCILGGVHYMFWQNFFYGHPLANFLLNVVEHIALDFPWYLYAIRYLFLGVMVATSCVLFFKNRMLFAVNSVLTAIYLYFGLFGFEYTLFAVQAYYSWMFLYTVLAIGYILAEPEFLQSPIARSKL